MIKRFPKMSKVLCCSILICFYTNLLGQGFNYELISNWEDVHPAWEGGGNDFVYEVVANPDKSGINPSDSCAHFITSTSVWDLIKLDLPAPANFNTYPIYWVKILAPPSGGYVWCKLENHDNTQSVTRASSTNPGAWHEIAFDFTGESSGIFTRLVIFLDFNGNTPGNDWYIDDVARSEPIPDTLPPSRPENLMVSDTFAGRVQLQWDASTDDNYVNLYRIFTDGLESGISSVNSYEVSGLLPETSYSFFVLAEDEAGNQSLPSDTIFATTKEAGNNEIIQSISLSTNTVSQYEPIDVRILLESLHQNPYDADDVRVDLHITRPDGAEILLPCYYDTGPPQAAKFIGRFSPRMTGTYTFTVSVEDLGGADLSDPMSFEVSPSSQDGFLHTDPQSPYLLRFDSGKGFRGIGENFGWEARIDLNDDQKYTYAYMFEELAKVQANFVRTWMCPWNLPLEWKITDFGRYPNTSETYNPAAIERMDYMLEEAQAHDIYLMLALDYHGALTTQPDFWGGNNYWTEHNYHLNQGGPATNPRQFFTDPEARRLYKNRLRFLVARWGWHPHIAAWEFWNEVDNAQVSENIPVADVVTWHNEMASYLKSIDPYDHIVTTSISHVELAGLFHIDGIDISQSHLYGITDQIPGRISTFLNKYEKPYVVGEFAHDWTNPAASDLPDYEADLRKGLWMGMFSPTPILPMTWWWIAFDQGNLNRHYEYAALYQDVILEDPQTVISPIETEGPNTLQSYGLSASGHYFLWVHNATGSSQSGRVSLQDMEDGSWFVTQYDTRLGLFDSLAEISVNNGQLSIDLSELAPQSDRAFVMRKDAFYVFEDTTGGTDPGIPLVQELVLSPNPVEDKLLVNHFHRLNALRIVDLKGCEIARLSGLDQTWVELDVSGLQEGVYILSVETLSGSVEQRKFVKI